MCCRENRAKANFLFSSLLTIRPPSLHQRDVGHTAHGGCCSASKWQQQ